ncbi:MAG: inosine-5-monophosphate dehydrogenase [Alphaproteobacteria bacterium]|nr:MAG: inosine-5-monophosphate dehydrogenase [Alphaproteobacteria bacterium]
MHVQAILGNKGGTVVSIQPQATIAEACRLFAEHRIGAVLVMEDDRVVGVFSERDTVRALAQHGGRALDIPLSEVMTRDVLTCSPEDSIDDIMGVMTARRVRHLPVVEEGRLIGIISIGDVVKYRLEQAALEVDSLREYVLAGR